MKNRVIHGIAALAALVLSVAAPYAVSASTISKITEEWHTSVSVSRGQEHTFWITDLTPDTGIYWMDVEATYKDEDGDEAYLSASESVETMDEEGCTTGMYMLLTDEDWEDVPATKASLKFKVTVYGSYDEEVKANNTFTFGHAAGRDKFPTEPEGEPGSAVLGSKALPWKIGGDIKSPKKIVKAYTNGNELVIGGKGTIANLSAVRIGVKGGIAAVAVTEATVTGAAKDAFSGFDNVMLTLPENWQGELPEKDGNWYGAKVDRGSFKIPMAVKNVKSRQRYPWNGLVDIACDLTGAGEVTLRATVLTNGVKLCAAKTIIGETTINLDAVGGVTNDVKFIWNAKDDLPAGFNQQNIQVKVTATE